MEKTYVRDRISPLYDRMRCKSRWGPLQRRRRVSVRERAVDNLRGADDDVATTCKPAGGMAEQGSDLARRRLRQQRTDLRPWLSTVHLSACRYIFTLPACRCHTPSTVCQSSDTACAQDKTVAIAMHSFPGIALLDVQTLFKPNFSLAQQTRRCLYFFQRPCP